MANRHDDIVKVFVANAQGTLDKSGFTVKDLSECNGIVRDLAMKGDPMSRYQIAEVTTFVVNDLLQTTEDFLNKLGDVKSVALGEKALFNVAQNEVTAYIQAKGGTPMRSKIHNRYVSPDTVEVAARPYMNMQDLATGRLDFTKMAASAAREMANKKMLYVQEVLNAGLRELGAGAYVAATDLKDASIFNPILANFRRQAPGKTTIIGDIAALDNLDWTITSNYANAQSALENIMNVGNVGRYKGCDVVAFENPILDSTLAGILNSSFIYFLAGEESPLKIVNEGDVRTMEQQNIDDESYEQVLRQNFGAALVIGHHTNMGAVEITG